MLRRLILVLALAVVPAAAIAGIRATYAVEHSHPVVIEIADNGDMNADLDGGRTLIVKAGQAYLVEDRLTGPVVMRLDDLAAIARERSESAGQRPAGATADFGLVERGTAEVHGRTGRAYFFPDTDVGPGQRFAVIGDDPSLADLGAAARQAFAAEMVLSRAEGRTPQATVDYSLSLLRVLERGTALQFGQTSLRAVERRPIPADAIALPAAPEPAEALRARLALEADEAQRPPVRDQMISRAAFAHGRLFLLADNGALSSLAEGDRVRTRHDPGESVLDICVDGGDLLALTGARAEGRAWTVRRWHEGRWATDRSVPRARDAAVALSCGPQAAVLLTSRRLIDLRAAAGNVLELRGAPIRTLVNAVVHATPDAVFVGLNAGEWGGGLKRIDRRTGRIDVVQRNATGGLCDGPLNTDCDPVHGIATIPWRPECVAAAIGLIHMAAHGRIVSVCPAGVEQLFAANAEVDEANPEAVREAASGGYGAVAFFGLAAVDRALVAVGHNGLHRIEADGTGTHQRLPRFVEVDGVLVSFAVPGFVLVVTGINGRASMGGAAPMLVVR